MSQVLKCPVCSADNDNSLNCYRCNTSLEIFIKLQELSEKYYLLAEENFNKKNYVHSYAHIKQSILLYKQEKNIDFMEKLKQYFSCVY